MIKLEKNQVKFYLKASEQFKTNPLICQKWSMLAAGLKPGGDSFRSLPKSLWNLLAEDAGSMLEAVATAGALLKDGLGPEPTLRQYLKRILEIEEPLVLSVYAPIVRTLRSNWTDRAMDFYVMTRSHITTVTRLIEPFCGEPEMMQRSSLLVHRFEEEIQRTRIQERAKAERQARIARKTARRKTKRAPSATAMRRPKAQRKARPKQGRAISRRAAGVAKRKPLVRNIKLARRRARR
ncbi:MAG: hypothetical protein ABIG68_09300 [Acidobacteriota bacterium]